VKEAVTSPFLQAFFQFFLLAFPFFFSNIILTFPSYLLSNFVSVFPSFGFPFFQDFPFTFSARLSIFPFLHSG
jgi:hypothetical protein